MKRFVRILKRLIPAFVVLLVVLVVLAGVRGLVAMRSSSKNAKPTADLAIPVATAQAKIADVPLTIDGIGTVQALNTVNIKPMVDGPLTEIHFGEGQDVRQGDVLARIDQRTYQAAYDQAVAKKAQDEATLANAQRDLTRYDKLAKTQYTTAQQADTQRATVAQDQAIVRQDQAQIDSARTNLSYTTIVAPVDGRVGIRQVDIGNLVHSTDVVPLTVLTTLRPISVVFTLPQQNLGDVVAAIQANRAQGGAPVEALPQDGSDPADPSATPTGTGSWPGHDPRQPSRPEYRDDQAQGGFSQSRSAPLAGRVRECSSFASHGQPCGDGAYRSDPARPAGCIRLPARSQRGAPTSHHCQSPDGTGCHRHPRACCG